MYSGGFELRVWIKYMIIEKYSGEIMINILKNIFSFSINVFASVMLVNAVIMDGRTHATFCS